MSKKQITNEDLASMIKKGFDGHDTRLDGIDTRLDGVDTRLEKIDTRLEKIDTRMDNIEQGQEEIKSRVGNMAYQFEVNDLKRRVKKLEFKAGIKTT
ncbi:MAG: hypothetical protein V1686_00025 [Patescibacteria group bacterium]